ncbi:MAG: prepilin-type N-terminal cleavage/methylation domain-containing protein [Candidatus Spechtbacteria bacterium]|nr:prepilin-type N-terminal cleavage/methylation domain-containing protein [Candidatus Spechtbacteria bacterium]
MDMLSFIFRHRAPRNCGARQSSLIILGTRLFLRQGRIAMTYRGLRNGYTLIELLLGVAIFSIVAGVGAIAFISALQAQRNLIAEKNLSDSTRFAIEYMSRQMRLAQIDATGVCVVAPNNTFFPDAPPVSSDILFINSSGKCIKFSSGANKIQMWMDGTGPIDLTSISAVQITNLSFLVQGGAQSDSLQPLVTISMTAQGVVKDVPTGVIVPIQTTVSDRPIDVPQS